MVVMPMANHRKLQLKIELFRKLAVAQAQRASGDKGPNGLASNEGLAQEDK